METASAQGQIAQLSVTDADAGIVKKTWVYSSQAFLCIVYLICFYRYYTYFSVEETLILAGRENLNELFD